MIRFLTFKLFTREKKKIATNPPEVSKVCPDKGNGAGEVSGTQVSWAVAEGAGVV